MRAVILLFICLSFVVAINAGKLKENNSDELEQMTDDQLVQLAERILAERAAKGKSKLSRDVLEVRGKRMGASGKSKFRNILDVRGKRIPDLRGKRIPELRGKRVEGLELRGKSKMGRILALRRGKSKLGRRDDEAFVQDSINYQQPGIWKNGVYDWEGSNTFFEFPTEQETPASDSAAADDDSGNTVLPLNHVLNLPYKLFKRLLEEKLKQRIAMRKRG
eukprot:TRINITY_DN2126_c0_g1_i6.p1 TRINITY_DN2126_c0_g1~~TRINITY_DN2126_c0_g1_i6.p1  ORF type:complete len:220 (-),score=76.15 TRINITY_DN2126_c0_g1_i6:85-744(-)